MKVYLRKIAATSLFATLLCGVMLPAALAQTGAGQSAVVLNYQRFDDARYPDTSVPASLFDGQLEALATGRYNIVHASRVVDSLFNGTTLPNRSVAITIDDAYSSAYSVAWPRLKKAGFPVTLFVSTDAIDGGGPAFMTWDQIRELKKAGVEIGAHGAAHSHLVTLTPEEIRADIEHSARRIREELGEPPVLFSYPHGEMSRAVRDAIAAAGFKAAFGQHSGVVNETLDRFMLPRFSINGRYGSRREFEKRIDALGLPLSEFSPEDPYILGNAPLVIGLTLDDSLGRDRDLHCFHSTAGDEFLKISATEVGDQRYELRFGKAFPAGPWRVNCTVATGGKRIRWWGMQFYSAG
jgi:peptidoglycan/xylan/chitin deacetylase (PgdA/CDA1 family)